jgi:hypothetical protein
VAITVESICSMNRATARMRGVTRIKSVRPGGIGKGRERGRWYYERSGLA